ncbi:uncharacterized protein V1516DRAFT_664155 [Lipomyces oligophaga]|uniref:uncharacterized protein n=1 Tax=Lipomyces oligophaga TaxID=45792 RepID=UPI0034CDEE70
MASSADGTSTYEDVQIQKIINSDIGVDLLSKRLKSSIVTGKEFAAYAKKQSISEISSATSLQRVINNAKELFEKKNESDSLSVHMIQAFSVQLQIVEHGKRFASQLNIMHDEVSKLCKETEQVRKSLKDTGLADEKNVITAEQVALKCRDRYNQACADLEAIRLGESRRSGLHIKNNKTPQQLQEEQARKVDVAELDYKQKVADAQRMLKDLLEKLRPSTVKRLCHQLDMFDSGLALQFQRYANLCEAYHLSNSLSCSPMKAENSKARGLKDIASDVNPKEDFRRFVLKSKSATLRRDTVQFISHPSRKAKVVSSYASNASIDVSKSKTGIDVSKSASLGASSARSVSATTSTTATVPLASASVMSAGSSRTTSQPLPISTTYGGPSSNIADQRSMQSESSAAANAQLSSASANNKAISQSMPPSIQPVDPSQFGQSTSNGYSQSTQSSPYQVDPNAQMNKAQTEPVSTPAGAIYEAANRMVVLFGCDLETVMSTEREIFQVGHVRAPHFVEMCVSVVENLGLGFPKIYMTQGSMEAMQHLRDNFESRSPLEIDLMQQPELYGNDVYAVASLLKVYFQMLPEPLLTYAFYNSFVQAADIPNEAQRRNAIHGLVNELPDPNYTTLSLMAFHLVKVQDHSRENGMTLSELIRIWAPILLGNQSVTANRQEIVLETICANVDNIFLLE